MIHDTSIGDLEFDLDLQDQGQNQGQFIADSTQPIPPPSSL